MDLTENEKAQLIELGRWTRPVDRGFVHELETIVDEDDRAALATLEARGLVKTFASQETTITKYAAGGFVWHGKPTTVAVLRRRLTPAGLRALENLAPEGIDMHMVRAALAQRPPITGEELARIANGY